MAALSRYVPISTLHAVEQGSMVPSRDLLSTIAKALEVDSHSWDLEFLASVHQNTLRQELLDEALASSLPWPSVQRALGIAVQNPRLSKIQRYHALWILAEQQARRGHWLRVSLLLERLASEGPRPRMTFRRRALSMLARAYLYRGEPHRALTPLLEVTKVKLHDDVWESATNNLALAWWELGQYSAATIQWQAVLSESMHQLRRAHAYIGLGNVHMRRSEYERAASEYGNALKELRGNCSDSTEFLRVFNNLLACYTRQADWTAAEAIIQRASAYMNAVDTLVYGEFLATCAEWAWMTGRHEEATNLIQQSKHHLGEIPTSSWFDVRLLEIRSHPLSAHDLREHLHGIRTKLKTVTDERRLAHVHLSIVKASLENGDVPSAIDDLDALQSRLGNTD